MPAAQFRRGVGGLGVGIGGGVKAHAFAVPLKGRVPPGEQMLLQMPQSRSLRLFAQGEVAQFMGYFSRVQAVDQPVGAAPLGQENPAVGGFLRVHGQGDGQAMHKPRGLRQQLAEGLLQHVEAVDPHICPVHHMAGSQTAHGLLLLHGLIREPPGDHLLVGLPDQRKVAFLGLRRAGEALRVLPQLSGGQPGLLHVPQEDGHLVRQPRLACHPPVVLQLLPAQCQRLADGHAAAPVIQGGHGIPPAPLVNPAVEPAGGEHIHVDEPRQVQAVDQLPLRLQGVLLRHQQQHADARPAA